MTSKEYFQQAYKLDRKIKAAIEELDRLRDMSVSISNFQSADRVQSGSGNEARFVKCIDMIQTIEKEIQSEIDLYIRLQHEIRGVIDKIQNTDEKLLLKNRYILNKSWDEIEKELFADRATIFRWHNSALNHAKIPKNHIII